MPLWEVMGGGEKGGIVIREGRDLTSKEEQERLSTGALVFEREVAGERLRYLRMSGTGPMQGWASLRIKDKPLLVQRPLQRKVRVLALHGAPGNSNIMKFQTAALRKLAGEDFDWAFLDGPCAWAPVPGATAQNFTERTAMEKSIAKGKAFVQWYTHPIPDEAAPGDSNGVDDGGKPKEMNFDNVQYLAVEETIAFLDKHFAASPTDIIVAFSQAGTMLALYADALRKAQRPIPWRLSVLVCGSMIDDPRYALQEPLDHAALYIHGGDADPWGRHGERMVPKMYRELEMLEHEDGHGFPASHPRAQEIYQRLLQRMYMSVTDLLER